MKRHRFNVPIKLITLSIIVFLALMFIIGYIWKVFKASDYFKIKDIISREGNTAELSYLKGKNIFSIDLRNESRYILEFYPDFSNIRLVRLLPGRIFVDFVKRKPLAYVKLYKYFSVDENGVLFYPLAQPQDLELPIILGLETKIFGPKSGKLYNIKELVLALNIIKETKRNSVLKKYKIKKINAASSTNASVFMETVATDAQDLEIKLNADNINNKITILAGLFTQEKDNLDNIKYIDLRFRETVIKFKDATK